MTGSQYSGPLACAWESAMSVAPPAALAAIVPLSVGQSMPKNGVPRMTLDAGTAAVYWASVVWLLNMPLVSGDAAEAVPARLSS